VLVVVRHEGEPEPQIPTSEDPTGNRLVVVVTKFRPDPAEDAERARRAMELAAAEPPTTTEGQADAPPSSLAVRPSPFLSVLPLSVAALAAQSLPEGQDRGPAPIASPTANAAPSHLPPLESCEPCTTGVPWHICAWDPTDGWCSVEGCRRRAPSFRVREAERAVLTLHREREDGSGEPQVGALIGEER
jgi:hypothetical protein